MEFRRLHAQPDDKGILFPAAGPDRRPPVAVFHHALTGDVDVGIVCGNAIATVRVLPTQERVPLQRAAAVQLGHKGVLIS